MKEERKNTGDEFANEALLAYEKEFGYLNQLEGKIPFDLCEDNVFCKKNFFTSTAWYIEVLKKEKPDSWEKEIQTFIDSILNGSLGKGLEMLNNINYFFTKIQLKWFVEKGNHDAVIFLEYLIKHPEYLFKPKENGKTRSSIIGVKPSMIPEWYYMWTVYGSSLYREIRDENVKNMADLFSGKRE